MFTILLSIHLALCLIYHLLNYWCFPCPGFDSQHSPVTLKATRTALPWKLHCPPLWTGSRGGGSQLATTCGLQPCSFCFVFFQSYWGSQKTAINIHSLVVLDICVHSCYHQHDPGDKQTHHLQKFPCVPWRFPPCLFFFGILRRLNLRFTLLTNFQVHSTSLPLSYSILLLLTSLIKIIISYPFNNSLPFPPSPTPW